MESAIAVYTGELCGCGGWYVVCFFRLSFFPLFLSFFFFLLVVVLDLLIEILFYMYRSLPHRLRGKRRSEIFWCVFGRDSFDCEWTLYFDVAGE